MWTGSHSHTWKAGLKVADETLKVSRRIMRNTGSGQLPRHRAGQEKAEFGILLPAQGVNLHSPAQRHLVPCSSSLCSELDSILSFSILYQTKFIMFWQRQLPSLSLQGLLQNCACGCCTVPQLYWNAEVMRSYTWVWIHLLILLCYMLGFFFSNLGEN